MSSWKLQRNLEAFQGVVPHTASFLVLSGSFDPIHADHLRALISARAHLEGRGIRVVVGYLAPSSETYVNGKLGMADAMTAQDRVATCKMACADSDWIDVCDYCVASGTKTADMLSAEIKRVMGVDLTPIVVYGADFFVKYGNILKDWKVPVVCVGRGEDTHKIQRILRTQCQKDGVPYTGSYRNFHLAESCGGEVSSTAIRSFLHRRDWAGLEASGMVPPPVVAFLQHGHYPVLAGRVAAGQGHHTVIVHRGHFSPITVHDVNRLTETRRALEAEGHGAVHAVVAVESAAPRGSLSLPFEARLRIVREAWMGSSWVDIVGVRTAHDNISTPLPGETTVVSLEGEEPETAEAVSRARQCMARMDWDGAAATGVLHPTTIAYLRK